MSVDEPSGGNEIMPHQQQLQQDHLGEIVVVVPDKDKPGDAGDPS